MGKSSEWPSAQINDFADGLPAPTFLDILYLVAERTRPIFDRELVVTYSTNCPDILAQYIAARTPFRTIIEGKDSIVEANAWTTVIGIGPSNYVKAKVLETSYGLNSETGGVRLANDEDLRLIKDLKWFEER